jgi:cytochrome c oxidase assembly protein subunit 15
MPASDDTPVPPRWLHGLAILTVCATLPLLFLGAEVTTKGVGMVDPVGFRPPGQLVAGLLADEHGNHGLRIEYSHRLAGMVVGTLMIGLAAALWFVEKRRSVRWLGVAALGLVCLQGILGKYRVDLDALFHRNLALVHGLFAQVVIATLVCLAVVLSRGWVADRADATNVTGTLRRWSLLTAVVVLVQLALGGMIRHTHLALGPRGHLLGAFVVTGCVLWLIKLTLESEQRASFTRAALILACLLGLQLFLGVETWLSKFHVPTADLPQLEPLSADTGWLSWLRSAHYVAGTMIFAICVVVALKANRRPVVAALSAPVLEAAL